LIAAGKRSRYHFFFMNVVSQTVPYSKRWFQAKPAGAAVSSVLTLAMGKRGFYLPDIILKWHEIAGDALAAYTLPQKLVFPPLQKNHGCLHIGTVSAQAPYVDYARLAILDRLNVLFGYHAVTELRITHLPPDFFNRE
jgi:hypothetical protein